VLHEEDLPQPVTPAGILHWLEAQPRRAQARLWVWEDEGRVVGWGEARLNWATSAPGVGDVWVFVAPRARGKGLGSALYEETERYMRGVDARVLQTWTYTAGGRKLIESRGFRATQDERVSVIELAQADLSEFAGLEERKSAEGFRLAPLQAIKARAPALHRVYAAASADVPEYFKEDAIRLEEWRRETLEHPQLSGEGSFVVLSGDDPVALAFLEVDEPARIAANELTGTLPEFRRRGLARLAKLASLRWAAAQGFERVVTVNSEANPGMLALNDGLGYRAVRTETHYVRDL